MSSVRILVVDDSESFRNVIISRLRTVPELEVISGASDGFEAVQKAKELQPDLILLDIGLPGQSGIDAARQIRSVIPDSKIIFVSQEMSIDIVEEALRLGAQGYVAKTSVWSDLLDAVEAVICSKRFVSTALGYHLSLAI